MGTSLLGAATEGVGADPDEPQYPEPASVEDYAGWVLQHVNVGKYRTSTGTAEVEHSIQSSHVLDYLDSKWVRFQNPKPDEGGGCWQHTFRLGSIAGATANNTETGRTVPDTIKDSIFEVTTAFNEEGVAVAPRRDPATYGFIDNSFLVDDDGAVREDVADAIEHPPQEYSAADLEAIHNKVIGDADQTKDVMALGAFVLAQAAGRLLDGYLGVVAEKGIDKADSVLGFLVDAVTQRPGDVEDQAVDQGFGHRNPVVDGGTGHHAVFDVYVAPDYAGSITVTMTHTVDSTLDTFEIEEEYQEDVVWEIYFNPASEPEKKSDVELDPTEYFSARPLEPDDPVSFRESETNVPIGLWEKGQPRPRFEVDPEVPVPGEQVVLDASDSEDPDVNGGITDYDWEIVPADDGDDPRLRTSSSTSTPPGERVEHTFANSGNYEVTLTVTDEEDATSSITETVGVTVPPEAELTAEPREDPVTGQTITFDGSESEDPDGDDDELEYSWSFYDWSDGWRDSIPVDIDEGEPTVEASFDEPGKYEAFLTVTDPAGAEDSAQVFVEVVENDPPSASFTVDPDPVVEDRLVTFDASGSEDPEEGELEYSWSFYDWSDGWRRSFPVDVGDEPVVSTTFEDSAKYEAYLTVTDPGGAEATAQEFFRVVEAEATYEVVDFTGDMTVEASTEAEVEATIENTGTVADLETVTYRVDGSEEASENVYVEPGESKTLTFTYTAPSRGGTESHSFETADDSASGTVDIVEADAEMWVVDFTGDMSVDTSETVEVAATIENRGDAEDLKYVRYLVDGSKEDSTNVYLAPGERETVTFTYTAPSYSTDESHSVQTPSDSASGTITVDDGGSGSPGGQATFSVTSFTGDMTVETLESYSVSATIENTGDEEGTKDVQYLKGGVDAGSQSVSLAPGERTTVTFTSAASPYEGEKSHSVQTADDSAFGTLTVVEQKGEPNFSVTSFTGDMTVRTLETVTVSATIENTGDKSGNQDVTYYIDGLEADSTELWLGEGESRTVTFSYTADPYTGEDTHRVETADDSASGTITIVE